MSEYPPPHPERISSVPAGRRSAARLAAALAAALGTAAADPGEPLAPLPPAAPEGSAAAALGHRLFDDPVLSRGHRRACSTCHPLERGAMDGKPRAEGLDGSPLRNTPTLFNVCHSYLYNWDGATTTLADHTERLLRNPRVMDGRWPELLAALGADPQYRKDFAAAYPDGLTQANVIDALTRFECTLATPNARFDRYLRGEAGALSADERRGYALFKSFGCVACHQGVNIGGNLFQKFGVFGPPRGGDGADAGRYAVTGSERDRGVYRVPSLRNVAATAPYFHDGRAATLEEAVDTMAREQLGRRLETGDRDLIVQFLKTLTGEFRGTPVGRGERGG